MNVSNSTCNFLAIDLGASGGRVFKIAWNGSKLKLKELHRFANSSVSVQGHLHWDVLRLWSEIKIGLGRYARENKSVPAGIAIDAWGVDFALLDSADSMLGNPYTYRDRRTEGIPSAVFAKVSEKEMFRETGVQSWQINTLFQIFSMAQTKDPGLEVARTMLMIPDLFNFWLSGEKTIECSVGSTSEMFRTEKAEWAVDLLNRLGIPTHFLPSVTTPGTFLAPMRRELTNEISLKSRPPIIAVAAHDTASTVAAIPGMDADSVFISSGTWSLMGVEISETDNTELALTLGFSNERGVAGSILLLRNITGLWILQECMRQWRLQSKSCTWAGLVKLAEKSEPFRSLIDTDAPQFLAPDNMLLAICNFCQITEQPRPKSLGEYARCCIESLSLRYREVLESLEKLTRRRLSTVRVAGGGCRNRMLCQFTANATNRNVITGPIEASVLGNAVAQAVAIGHIKDFGEGRRVIASSTVQLIYEPRMTDAWTTAFYRFQKLSRMPNFRA